MSTSQAFVFLETKGNMIHGLIRELEDTEGIESVEIITGPYDLIVKINSRTAIENLQLVIEKIHGMEGVIRTHTSIVFEIQ